MLTESGGAEGNRTPDLIIANDALSQLSYSPAPKAVFRTSRAALSMRDMARDPRAAGRVADHRLLAGRARGRYMRGIAPSVNKWPALDTDICSTFLACSST